MHDMSHLTYTAVVRKADKPLLWLRGEVRTPPFSAAANRKETKR